MATASMRDSLIAALDDMDLEGLRDLAKQFSGGPDIEGMNTVTTRARLRAYLKDQDEDWQPERQDVFQVEKLEFDIDNLDDVVAALQIFVDHVQERLKEKMGNYDDQIAALEERFTALEERVDGLPDLVAAEIEPALKEFGQALEKATEEFADRPKEQDVTPTAETPSEEPKVVITKEELGEDEGTGEEPPTELPEDEGFPVTEVDEDEDTKEGGGGEKVKKVKGRIISLDLGRW